MAQNSEVTIEQEEIEMEEADSDDTDDFDMNMRQRQADDEVLEEAEYDEEEDEEEEAELEEDLQAASSSHQEAQMLRSQADVLRVTPGPGETMEQAKERELNMIKELMAQGKKIPKVIVLKDADGHDVEYEICAEDEEGEEENDS